MHLVTADEMRLMDKLTIEEFGIPARVLMENAGREAARVFLKNFEGALDKKIGVAAGSGNNGGDGFVIARCLASYGCASHGLDVTVFLFADPNKIKGEAKDNLNLLYLMDIPVIICDSFELLIENQEIMNSIGIWIDAILGTGLKSEVKDFLMIMIEFINSQKKPVFALDISSGLDSDTGARRSACIRADYTVSFGFAKVGHKLFQGADFTGILEVVDIGIPTHILKQVSPKQLLLTSDYLKAHFIKRKQDSHKGDFGHILIVGGSTGKTGAPILAAKAAMRSGAGLVTIAIAESLNPIIEASSLESMSCPLPESKKGVIGISSFEIIKELSAGKNCIAIGTGLGTDYDTKQLVIKIIEESSLPMVIDADALNCIAGDMDILKAATAPIILTPHPKEMARLINNDTAYVQQDRVKCAREFAEKFHVIVVLKGAGTVTAIPGGDIFINSSGNAGMASGGSGDVLTGIIAGFIAQGYSSEVSANMGVYIHGAAGDRAAEEKGLAGMIASDIVESIPKTLA